MQAITAQPTADAPTRDAQPTAGTTMVADSGAMDVDGGTTTREAVGEGHSGVKRKAGEDSESASKKLRMGMLIVRFHVSTTDTTSTRRTCRSSSEEVNPVNAPFILQLLTVSFRDRENCTVFVSELPESATQDDLKALFKDVS